MVRFRFSASNNNREYNSNGTTDSEDPDNNASMGAEGGSMKGNLLGYVPTPQDRRLRYFYGDLVHTNDGGDLSVRIIDNYV